MISALIMTAALGGGVCVQQQAVVQQQYVAPVTQPVYYFVGAPIREEALKHQDPDYQKFLEFKRFTEQQEKQTPPPVPQPQAEVTHNAIQMHCANCHQAPTEKNKFTQLTGEEELDPLTAMRALRSISYNQEQAAGLGFSAMPKGSVLTPAERNDIAHQIFSITKGL